MQGIHDEEVLRRQEFGLLFENHFLNTLFSGLEDMPPAFATIAPVSFDQNLPNLTKSGKICFALSLCLHFLTVFFIFCSFRFRYAQIQHPRNRLTDRIARSQGSTEIFRSRLFQSEFTRRNKSGRNYEVGDVEAIVPCTFERVII